MIESRFFPARNLMISFVLACLFCMNVSSLSRTTIKMMRSRYDPLGYSSELKPRSTVNPMKAKRRAVASESRIRSEKDLSCDLKIRVPIESAGSPLTCYFEKSSSCSSCKSGVCPVDNRPCSANRDYMDHVYGARFMPKPKPVFQSYKYSQQSQMHMYASPASTPVPVVPERKLSAAERRSRRQKLFLMSTWLEDLLPNPSQGRSWIFNSVCDTMKITTRVGRFIVSFIMMLTSASTLSSPSEEKNRQDSTSHGADHL